MAREDRATTPGLIDWERLARDLPRAGPFAVLRRAETGASDLPRLGRARRPQQSIVDIAQEPSLGFAGRSLVTIDRRHGRPQLRGHWLGLTGPMGPLPTHLTEAALYERQFAKQRPLGDWLDLLAGRMLQLFYRAWADSQPVAQADRPKDDNFSSWLGALSGAFEGARAEDGFFAQARAHYASVFVGLRSAIALQDALSHLLCQPVRVVEYISKWRKFEREDYGLLGEEYVTLGQDAVLGHRVHSVADAFRVIVRAKDYRAYLSLLPGGQRFGFAAEAIEAFKPPHLEWDLCVELDDRQAPPARLDGRTPLGWASWVKPASEMDTHMIRADAHLRKTSTARRKSAA